MAKSSSLGWQISIPLHVALLIAAGVTYYEQVVFFEPKSSGFSCGWVPPQPQFDALSYPTEITSRRPLQSDEPISFLQHRPSNELGLYGLPTRNEYPHRCGSCCCFEYLKDLPPSVLLSWQLSLWQPLILQEDPKEFPGTPLLRLRSIERRDRGFRVGVYTWR